MPNGPVSPMAAFILAFLAGLAATWVVLGVVVMAVFRGPDTELPLAILILPLVGLAVFQLIFVSLTRHWRGVRYWIVAGGLVYGLGGLALWASVAGWISALASLAILIALLGGIGLWRARSLPALYVVQEDSQ